MIDEHICYFCRSPKLKISRGQRTVLFESQYFRFMYCSNCRGYSLFPKLNDAQLFSLYSSDYVDQKCEIHDPAEYTKADKFSDLDHYLAKKVEGNGQKFLDYGCGADPVSFQMARKCGLDPYGMELSADVRAIAERNTGVKMFSREEIASLNTEFGIIFLGDVLEHLIDPVRELEFLRTKIAQRGFLIAQGPLQGANTLTHALVRLFAFFTQNRTTDYPPYHVSLASLTSMKKLLVASGFTPVFIRTSEVNWPAPTFGELRDGLNIRNFMIFTTKQADKFLARILPNYGTRYFLACAPNPQSQGTTS